MVTVPDLVLPTGTVEEIIDTIQRWRFLNGEPRVVRLRADVMNRLHWEMTAGRPRLDVIEVRTLAGLPVETVYWRDAPELEILGWR